MCIRFLFCLFEFPILIEHYCFVGLGRDMPDVSPILRKSLFELKLHRLQLF
eukprot:Pgem_evm1s10650